MALPLLFAVPPVAAAAGVLPRLIGEVIERGGDIAGGENPPSVEAQLEAEGIMDEMRRTAEFNQLIKKQSY